MWTQILHDILHDHLILSLATVGVLALSYMLGEFVWFHLNDKCLLPDQVTTARLIRKDKYGDDTPSAIVSYYVDGIPPYIPVFYYFIFCIGQEMFEIEVWRDFYYLVDEGDQILVHYAVTRLTKNITIRSIEKYKN